jgi:membrane fusion protein, macrolide-specific efflux system
MIRHRRRLIAAFGITILLAFACLHYLYLIDERAPHYLTAEVTRADLEDAVLAGGTLHAVRQVDVGAQVSGQLKSIHVQLGDKVVKGQPLAQIDPTLSWHALRQAKAVEKDLRAQRNAAVARVREAERIHARQQQLLPVRATSRENVERAEATLDVRRAELASLDAQIEKARRNRKGTGECRLYAHRRAHRR